MLMLLCYIYITSIYDSHIKKLTALLSAGDFLLKLSTSFFLDAVLEGSGFD